MLTTKKDDQYFLNLAIEEAEKALLLDEVPVGCVVIRDDVVICKSHNLTNDMKDPLAHAEYLCVTKLLQNND